MKKKFAEDPTAQTTKYKYEGYTQSKRKVEFKKAGDAIAKKRGISAYNPMVHMGGIPLGQRQLTPYTVSGTDITVEGDDLHFVNNAAMQQFWDDIRRTVIVGLDVAHQTLEKRLGKAVTPETISNYLAVLNHAMPGAAVVQEHMVETHPMLTDDCFVKVFTGDDDLADSIDKQYVIDINKAFPKDQAAALKKAIGKSLWQAVHIPTTVVRTCDGGTSSRWSAMQIGMSFIDAYKMCAGEAAVADLAFAAKHAALVEMANLLPARRARGPNEPGGLSFGFMADIVQTNRKYPEDPVKSSLEVVASGCMLYDQIWLGSYMSGGVGFTQYATAAYTDDILDDFTYYGYDYIKGKYGVAKAKAQHGRRQRRRHRSYPVRYRTVREVPDHPRGPLRWLAEGDSPVRRSRCHHRYGDGQRKRWPGWLVPVHVPAQGSMGQTRILRVRPAGPVRRDQRILVPLRRGRHRRAERPELPELRHERGPPGRLRRHRRCTALRPWRCVGS